MTCRLCLGLEIIENARFKDARYHAELCYVYPHHQSYSELQRSAEAGCRVCEFFEQELLRSASRLQRTFSLPSGAMTVSAFSMDSKIIKSLVVKIESSAIEDGAIEAVLEPFVLPRTGHPSRSAGYGTARIVGRHFSHDPSSHQSFAWIEQSIYECYSSTLSHLRCPKQSNWESPLPDRVLDLEASNEDGDLRLKTNEMGHLLGKYIALSHCWGQGPRPLESTTKNLSSYLNRIKFNDLPRSFQDAVRICRRLSVRYLWLDTLCILQDSRDDWAEQASKMARVYENAFLTLAFSGARNSEQAILSPRLPLHSVRLGGRLAHVHLRNILDENIDTQHGELIGRRDFKAITQLYAPLGQRAWAYQESYLSSRVLYFTSCQLAWKCQEGAFIESSVEPQEFRSSYGLSPLTTGINRKSVNCIAAWQVCVEHFSGLSITVASDKLVAFSGIAKRFATLLQDEYIAGLWKSSLPDLLLWQIRGFSNDRHVRPLAYRAPSWSWAAIDGPILYSALSADTDSHLHDMRLTRVASESVTSDVFGAVKAAQLHVHGFCVEVVQDSRVVCQLTVFRGPERVEQVAVPVVFQPDIGSDIGQTWLYPPQTKFTFLQINRRTSYLGTNLSDSLIQGLVLEEVKVGSGVFRRVGYAELMDLKSFREEWVQRDLTLV